MPRLTPKRPRKTKASPKPQTARKRVVAPGTSPISGVAPPAEYQFKEGNQAAVGYGRPRKMDELQELIKDVLAEEMAGKDPATGQTIKMTRAIAMIRTMLIKSPSDRIALLEYAFGKVPNVHEIKDWRDIARRHNLPEEKVIALVREWKAAMLKKIESPPTDES